jgi:hypothetical protein
MIKLQWLWDSNQINKNNLKNVSQRREGSKIFGDKRREYLKNKITYSETKSENENIEDRERHK